MRITSGGNVGIGTTSPGYRLSVQGADNSGIFIKQGSQIADSPASTNFYSGLTFENISTTNAWSIGYSQGAKFSINYFNASSTYTRVLTADASGNIGIGTTSPGKALEIYRAGSATAQLKIGDASTPKGYLGVFSNALYITAGGTFDSGWSTDGSNGIANIVLETTNGGSAIAFGTAASNTSPSERMRIASNGDLQLNQTISTIKTSANNSALVLLANPSLVDNETRIEILGRTYSTANSIFYRAGTHVFTDSSASTERMRITSAGYLVLGGTSSAYGQAGRGTFEMNGSADNILAMRIGGSLAGYLYTNSSSMELYSTTLISFSTNGAERMRITSGGDIIKATGSGFDGTYDNLIKYMARGDIGVNNNRWTGIDATITAGGASANAMRFRVYQGSASQDQPPLTVMTLLGDGTVQPGANGTQNLGTSSLRWATVFTSDLSLSNGIGDYTIVEGENDLFLYNNKQNKVYKFVIEEVDPLTATPKKS
jgi:hypothetical protein